MVPGNRQTVLQMSTLFELDFGLGLAIYIMIPVFITGVVGFCFFIDNYIAKYRKQIRQRANAPRRLRCKIAYFSEKGARPKQEDSYYISPMKQSADNGVICVVSDGIGGLTHGDEVSAIVTERIAEAAPMDFDDTENNSTILRGISRDIYNKYKLEGGATLAMVHIKNDYMNIYSCGDSNIILIRNRKAIMLNSKQNYLSLLINKAAGNGEVTKGCYLDKDARALVDFMGNSFSRVNRTCKPIRLFNGDYIIVSSDGITDAIPLHKIPHYLQKSAFTFAERLKFTIRSSRRPSQDNYTAVVIKMEFDLF